MAVRQSGKHLIPCMVCGWYLEYRIGKNSYCCLQFAVYQLFWTRDLSFDVTKFYQSQTFILTKVFTIAIQMENVVCCLHCTLNIGSTCGLPSNLLPTPPLPSSHSKVDLTAGGASQIISSVTTTTKSWHLSIYLSHHPVFLLPASSTVHVAVDNVVKYYSMLHTSATQYTRFLWRQCCFHNQARTAKLVAGC